MSGNIGPLSYAPLVYVLCQVKYSAVLDMRENVPQIQKILRQAYPIYSEEVVQGFKIHTTSGNVENTTSNRWVFNDKNRTSGFILQTDSLLFHTTVYKDFDDFSGHLFNGLSILAEQVEIALVERVGLRYIDQIVPKKGEHVNDYVKPGLFGCQFADVDPIEEQHRSVSNVVTQAGQLVVKFSRAVHENIVPDDLMPLALATIIEAKIEEVTGMLDIDHFLVKTADFDIERIKRITTSLHEGTSDAFISAVSSHAMKVWK